MKIHIERDVTDVTISDEQVEEWQDLWDPDASKWPFDSEDEFLQARARSRARQHLREMDPDDLVADCVSITNVESVHTDADESDDTEDSSDEESVQDDAGDVDDDADADPTCGVNGCGRTVDSPEDTCWQHDEEDDEE